MPSLPSNQIGKLVNRGSAGLLNRVDDAAAVYAPTYRAGTPNNIHPSLWGLVVPLEGLVFDPNNARTHPEKSIAVLKHSLSVFGQRKPIVVREEGRVIVAGNGTAEAAKALGWTQIAAAVQSMTDAEAAGYGLADNRSAEMSAWDFENAARMERLAATEGLGGVGWTDGEIRALLQDQRQQERDPDEVPEPPKVALSRSGDLWTLGKHRLLCGSSANAADVSRLLEGMPPAYLLCTDPPYGVDFEGQKYNPRAKAWAGIQGDKTQGADLQRWMASFLRLWLPYVHERFACYLWTASMQEGYAVLQGIKEVGLHVQSQIIWAKNVLVLGQSDYHWKHENCWYCFWKGKKHVWYGGRDQTSLWEVKKVATARYLHPMQKPTELYERSILNHTGEQDVLLEPFAGSGTQLIAAQKLGRRCMAMEVDPIYVDVCLARWSEYSGADPVRHDGVPFSSLVTNRTGKVVSVRGGGAGDAPAGTVSRPAKAPPRPRKGGGGGSGR